MSVGEFNLTAIPEALRARVGVWLETNARDGSLAGTSRKWPELLDELPRVVACSAYVAETLRRYPELLAQLTAERRLDRPAAAGEIDTMLTAELDPTLAEEEFQRRLRLLRHRELVRIAWRDLAKAAPLEETLLELSVLADAAIRAALDWAGASLGERHGVPRARDGRHLEFAVIAMGKLGGRELNFSSDVDLVFLYSGNGMTDGPRQLSAEEYFRLLGQRIVGLLSNKTSDGFVYRVDVRLRPFGDSGPLAVSLPALETYLMEYGRDWERYAYIKARVINDWSETDYFYDQVMRPFIYRRYLDYGVFSSLREMKGLIEAEIQRREFRGNVKLGPGGIREIEFIVQSLQLVRGGTVAELRERELMRVLPRLVRHECLPPDVADELLDAYQYLRLLENRLQAIADRQTHDLPDDELNRSRLALAMGNESWDEMRESLDAHREAVSRHFRNIVFRDSDEADRDREGDELSLAWLADSSEEVLAQSLARIGYPPHALPLEQLRRFRDSSMYRRIDETGRQRLDTLMPAVIEMAATQTDPLSSLSGALLIIEAIGRRSAYFALLNENPAALERLIHLCGMSEFLARQVATHPLLLDELLDPRVFVEAPKREDFRADLEARLSSSPDQDLEQQLDALRNFQQAATFRVAVADLSGTLPIMKVSDRLTDIAELVLQTALELAWNELTAKHGTPRCRDQHGDREAQFAIVAYGKLAGLELGYGSDLDLVFVHDSEGSAQQTDGDPPAENAVLFSRLTRRIIHFLTIPTTSGPLYEVDTRLRPSGRSGLLVSSLSALERYQREAAWTWEHQALLRSRAVAGHAAVMEGFEALRKRVLMNYVRRAGLRDQVVKMRQRMRDELCKGTAEDFDIKQDAGGVADIEFIVQYLVLQNARDCVELLRYPDNIRQLESLAKHGVLDAAVAGELIDIYRVYRRRIHHLALDGRNAMIPRDEAAGPAARVTAIWRDVFD
jgi:glutamate-ammonia-ligase adenylyltransferase